MSCVFCGSGTLVPSHQDVPDYEYGHPYRMNFVSCTECGALTQSSPLNAKQLKESYPEDYRPHVQAGWLDFPKKINGMMMARTISRELPSRSANILELGSGSGHFIRALSRLGYQNLTAGDQNSALNKAFENSSVRFLSLDIEHDQISGGPYDSIIMINTIEHMLDPGAVLSKCKRVLAPNGSIIIVTPNAESLCHRFFGRYWSGLHCPRHPEIFTPKAILGLARSTGFKSFRTHFLTDVASWTVSMQNRLQRKPHSSGMTIYSLAALPFWYPFALFERILGKSSSIFMVLS